MGPSVMPREEDAQKTRRLHHALCAMELLQEDTNIPSLEFT